MTTTSTMTWFAWINCGNSTPTMQSAETANHETEGFRHATRRGTGATQAEALDDLRSDCEEWDAIDADPVAGIELTLGRRLLSLAKDGDRVTLVLRANGDADDCLAEASGLVVPLVDWVESSDWTDETRETVTVVAVL